MSFLGKLGNFGLKFASKIEILVKPEAFLPKIEILDRNGNVGQNLYFGQKFKICSKIQILVKNSKFGQKFKFWPQIQILVTNSNFSQKLKCWSKIQ